MKKFIKYAISTLVLCACSVSYAELLMQWKRIPLRVDLHVGQERILFLDKNVQVGIPAELDGKLDVQSMGGAVYLKAKKAFSLQRLQLRDIESGQIILIDLKSLAVKGSLDSIRIIFDETVSNNADKRDQTSVSDSAEEEVQIKNALPIPAALTRYAAQSLYAPLRTVEPLLGVHRVAMRLPKSLPTLLPNLAVLATPLESWKMEEYVVTAVRIRNLESHRVNLDPRYLQGHFYAATFQHNWLAEKGTPEDTTVVYLVTQGSPNRAITPAVIKKKSTKLNTQQSR